MLINKSQEHPVIIAAAAGGEDDSDQDENDIGTSDWHCDDVYEFDLV